MDTVEQKQPSNGGGEKSRYRAPALEKGLQILELLAPETQALTLSAISERLGRSRSEIFRMVQELETCGYIRRSLKGEGYEVTNKLFLLGLEQPRTNTLLECALPVMRTFAHQAGQSCHLSVQVDDLIVVVARMEAVGPVGFSVRVGHRQYITHSTSGPVIFAFQPEDVQNAWLARFRDRAGQGDIAAFDETQFRKTARQIFKNRHFRRKSAFVDGVTDIAAPIMRGGAAIAALTSPCMAWVGSDNKQDETLALLSQAADQISAALDV